MSVELSEEENVETNRLKLENIRYYRSFKSEGHTHYPVPSNVKVRITEQGARKNHVYIPKAVDLNHHDHYLMSA